MENNELKNNWKSENKTKWENQKKKEGIYKDNSRN